MPSDDAPTPRPGECPEAGDAHAQRERIRQRAERWARLCRELSEHADELRHLRSELGAHGSAGAAPTPESPQQHGELAQREARLQRELQALQRQRREFEHQRRQFMARQRAREENVQQVCDRRMLQAARFEYDARRRLAEAATLAEEAEHFDAALDEMIREIECELGRFAAETQPTSPTPPQQARSPSAGH